MIIVFPFSHTFTELPLLWPYYHTALRLWERWGRGIRWLWDCHGNRGRWSGGETRSWERMRPQQSRQSCSNSNEKWEPYVEEEVSKEDDKDAWRFGRDWRDAMIDLPGLSVEKRINSTVLRAYQTTFLLRLTSTRNCLPAPLLCKSLNACYKSRLDTAALPRDKH